MLVESRMRGNVHVRFGGRKRGDGAGVIRSPRPLSTRHLPMSREEANLFFRLVARRYERASLIITSNKSFIDWGKVFGDQVLATAILDRLLHHSSTINIKGESFRLKQKRRAGLVGQPAAENTAAPARDSTKSSNGGTA
jgi:hypothetical protein